MGKKAHQIVDPETGEVIAEKRVVKIGPLHYEVTVKSRLALMLLRVAVVCFFLALMCGILFFFVPDDFMGYVAIPFAVFCVAMSTSAAICTYISRDDAGGKKGKNF